MTELQEKDNQHIREESAIEKRHAKEMTREILQEKGVRYREGDLRGPKEEITKLADARRPAT